MFRFLSFVCLVLSVVMFGSGVSAAPSDNGPPYTDQQFLALVGDRIPSDVRRGQVEQWWSRAPNYLRQRVLNAPSQMWWPILLCNFMGFKPEGMEAGGAEKCEQDWYRNSQRGRKNWSADGQWVGPSEECRKRDKRSQWGELICD
jgi:hypothetical protein